MPIHIKSRWHNEDSDRSLGEIASALAFTAWKIAKDRAINLHGERFHYDNDQQRIAVIAEYLYFQIHVLDRLAYEMLEEADRRILIVHLASKLSAIIQDNGSEILGPGDYGKAFVDTLNLRSNEYGEFNFTESGPSYPALRHLGYHIQQVMGEQDENRWVIDQVMDKDGGEVYKQIAKTLHHLSS